MFSLGDIVTSIRDTFRLCGYPSFGGFVRVGRRRYPSGFFVGIIGRSGAELRVLGSGMVDVERNGKVAVDNSYIATA